MHQSPIITITDLKKEKLTIKKFIIFSSEVQSILKKVYSTDENVIIFINRKALATSIICQDCGSVLKCPHCDVPLTFHQNKNNNFLLCHHCGYQTNPPLICPNCHSYKLLPLGLGTEKIESELKQFGFNENRIKILEGDLNDEIELDLINRFNKKQIKILIATEAIFRPQLLPANYIIIPNFDNLLFFPDFQNEEKIFNLLLKFKNITLNEIIIQTINPEQKILQYFIKNEINKFYQEELQWRQKYNWPPFTQIIKLTIGNKNQDKGAKDAENTKNNLINKIKALKLENKIEIIGPVPAFIFKERNKYYFNILLKIRYNKVNLLELPNNIFSLNVLEPILTKEELYLRNKILTLIPPSWKIDVNPKNIL